MKGDKTDMHRKTYSPKTSGPKVPMLWSCPRVVLVLPTFYMPTETVSQGKNETLRPEGES
jgi:hypothetical protein